MMSKTMKAALFASTVALLTVGSAAAKHINEETAYTRLQEEYGYIYELKCGTRLDVYIDFESFKPHYEPPYDIDEVVNYCGAGVSAMGLLCRDNPNFATAARHGLELYSCHWNEHALDEPSIGLQNNQLFVGFNWQTRNISSDVYEWVRSNF